MACRKAGVRAAAAPSPRRRVDGCAAAARRVPLGARRRSAPTCSVQSVSGGTDVCAAFVGAVPLLPVRGGRDQLPAARRSRWRRSIPTATCARRACRASWSSPNRCRRCRSGSGAIAERRAAARRVLQRLPGRLAPRRLDHLHRRRRVRDLRTLRRHAEPWRRAPRDQRLLRGRRSAARGGRQPGRAPRGRRPGPADGRAAAVRRARRRAPSSTTTCAARSCARCAPSCRRATCPTRSSRCPSIPRTLSGKKLEVPVKRILGGADADAVASRSSLADPAALDWYEEFAASR